jgi:hypothetical protein
MMLRSMGLGEVLDAAKKMAEAGALDKLIAFVDGIDELNATLKRIEARLGTGEQPVIEGIVVGRRVEAGSGSGVGPAA